MKNKLLTALLLLLVHIGLFAQITPVTCDKITVDSVLNSELNKNNIELIITNHDSSTAWSPENFTVLAPNGDTVGHIILCQGCVILMHNRTGKFYLPKNDTNFTIPPHYCCKLVLAASGHQICNKQYNGCIVAGIVNNSDHKSTISLFPNPASNTFQISWNTANNSLFSYHIINTQGKKIQEGQDIQTDHPIDIPLLSAGMYFVRVYQNGTMLGTQKLIIR